MILKLTLMSPGKDLFHCVIQRNLITITNESGVQHDVELNAAECTLTDIKNYIDWYSDCKDAHGKYCVIVGEEKVDLIFRDVETAEFVYEKDKVTHRIGYNIKTTVKKVILEFFTRFVF